MSDETVEAQGEEVPSESSPTTPAEIITQVLVETRDSLDPEEAIAQRILSALADAGCEVSGQSTAPAN